MFLPGSLSRTPARRLVFSPFGLGVLNIAASDFVLQEAISFGTAPAMPDSFSNSVLW